MDNSLQLLANNFRQRQLQQSEQSLWFIDEAARDLLPLLAQHKDNVSIQTNRYDIWKQANAEKLQCEFSDLNFDRAQTQLYDCAFIRISKEKAVVHRAINAMYARLKEHGTIVIAGEKKEGIKSYVDKLGQLSQTTCKPKKNGNAYIASCKRQQITGQTSWLDDDSYHKIRPIGKINGQEVYSKPGVFGWNKLDQGSELLISSINNYFKSNHLKNNHRSSDALTIESCLDLGCGYGYISLAMQQHNFSYYAATDNNAAAIDCLKYNNDILKLDIDLVAANCGDSITQKFDLVVCNPPFHQGFNVDGELSYRFLKAAKRLLKTNGYAFFVVNAFIPLEQKAREIFDNAIKLEQSPQFKVILLRNS